MRHQVYLINLERSADRLAKFQAQAAALGIEFVKIAAVDGGHPEFCYQPSKPACAESGPLPPGYRYYRSLIAEEVGCHLSHVKALEAFVGDGHDYALVLEDDAELGDDFPAQLNRLLDRHRHYPCWDVLKLHGRKKGLAVIDQVPGGPALVEHCSVPGGSFGTLWTRQGALRFLAAHQGHAVGRPLDVDLRYPWEFGATVLTTQPPLAHHEDTSGGATTTINDRRAAFKADPKPIQSALRKWSFQAHFLLGRLAYNCRRHGVLNAGLLECGQAIDSPARVRDTGATMTTQPRRLAVFVAFSGTGGVERVAHNLLQGFAAYADLHVDLLAVVGKKGWLPDIPWPNVRVVDMGTRHSQMALPALVRYLRQERPEVLMVAKDRAIRMAVIARRLAGVNTRLVGQLHNNISGYLANKPPLQRWLRTAPMRWLFAGVDRIICVSAGVVEDTIQITGLPRERMVAIRNPIITPDVDAKGDEPVGHPWFNDGSGIPVIIGAGRLTPEKDFATLIRAFQRVRQQKNCRLLIIGQGALQQELQALAAELGLADAVSLPGYCPNPFAYMKKSALFVLSSAWEGSGNVLVEALALGVPSVSTDCPYGPSETLANGQYGPLVPVGDDQALAEAMLATLERPLPPATLQEAVVEFSLAYSTRRYLEELGLADVACKPT